MICTVTMNPALDYIVFLPELKRGEINRASRAGMRPGGKGINVSAVLKSFGVSSLVTGFAAGRTGALLCELLHAAGISSDFVSADGMTRINVKIRAAEETDINGPGPAVREEAFAELLRKISRLPAGAVLVLAGSMPHSLPEGACGQIFSAAESMRVVADLPAAGLREVLAYRPWLVKPNREEAEALFGTPVLTRGDGLACAHRLCEEGARNAIVSLGALGAVMVSEEGCEYEVPAFSGKAVDTVGAGDSLLAGFLAAKEGGLGDGEALLQGVAAGCATAFRVGLAPAEEAFALLKNREREESGEAPHEE